MKAQLNSGGLARPLVGRSQLGQLPVERAPSSTYIELTKPRVTLMVVLTTAAGFYLAGSGRFDPALFLWTLIGTALLAGGASALNQYLERTADGRMRRTARRPIPSGRLSARSALNFGLLLIVAGTLLLAVAANGLTAFLGWLTAVVYLLLYTPLKTRTTLCTLVGAFPGAVPPLMGWAAVRGELDLTAWILFGIVFAWQFPHFLAIAWVYKEDYERGGFRMLPLVDPEGRRTATQIVLFTGLLLAISVLPPLVGLTGWLYLPGALAAGGYFLAAGLRLAGAPSRDAARGLLHASVIYLPIVLGLMVFDKLG